MFPSQNGGPRPRSEGDQENPNRNQWTDYREQPVPVPSSDGEEGGEVGDIRARYERERETRRQLERELMYEREQTRRHEQAPGQGMYNQDFIQGVVQATVQSVVGVLPNVRAPAAGGAPRVGGSRYRMPTPGSAGAPTSFTGTDGRALLSFFKRLEVCFEDAGVTAAEAKVRYVPRYMVERLQDWVEGLDGFEDGNYNRLKEAIFEQYGHPDQGPRYTREDLVKVVDQQLAMPVKTKEELYARAIAFDTIANPLLEDQVATEREINKAYFRTIPEEYREEIQRQLKLRFPNVNTRSEPFARAEVKNVAVSLLTPDWYAVQEIGDPRPLNQRMSEVERIAAVVEPMGAIQTPMEELVKQLSRLNVDDVQYATVHAALAQTQPFVARMFPPPTFSVKQATRSLFVPAPSQSQVPIPQAPGTVNRAPPPQVSNADECYYCMETGHRFSQCPVFLEHERLGYVKRENGKMLYKDGSWLRRRGTGGMKDDVLMRLDMEQAAARGTNQRAEKKNPPVDGLGSFVLEVEEFRGEDTEYQEMTGLAGTSYPMFADGYDEYMWAGMDDDDRVDVELMRGRFEEAGIDGDSAMRAAVVAVNEKQERAVRAARRAANPYQEAKTNRRPPQVRFGPSGSNETIQPTAQAPPKVVPTPNEQVHVPPAPANPNRQYPQGPPQILKRNAVFPVPAPPSALKAPMDVDKDLAKRVPARLAPAMRFTTEVEEKTNLDVVLAKLMSASVPSTITVGELCGVAPGLRKALLEMIRAKKVPVETNRKVTDVEPGTILSMPISLKAPQYMMPLPELRFKIHDSWVSGLLDTGSMINVMRKDFVERLSLPMNEGSKISMMGVHGDSAKAIGVCENVEIPFGKAVTRAHFHIFLKAPTKIILGQPWIRDHVISTTESGQTYKILLRDFMDPNHRVSVVVRADETTEDVEEVAASTPVDAWKEQVGEVDVMNVPLTTQEYEELGGEEIEEVDAKCSDFSGPLADWRV